MTFALDAIRAVSIRDIYPSGLDLDRTGVGKCPLPGHGRQSGKTPPFKVREASNTAACYACGWKGGAIDFWMELERCDFPTAIRAMAERFGIPLDDWTPEREQAELNTRRRQDVLGWVAAFYARQLGRGRPVEGEVPAIDSPADPAAVAYSYLEGRGFTAETITDLQLGLANKKLYGTLAGNPKIMEDNGWVWGDLVTIVDDDGRPLPVDQAPQNATSVGVITERADGRRYDYFRDRIIFPITRGGRVVALSGRTMPGATASKTKYKNLRGPIEALFLEDGIRRDETFVCEGLPDTITLHQWGLAACGQQGTQGMDRHAAKFKGCRVVYCCFDTDGPGQTAAIRAAKAIHGHLTAGEVKILQLPPGVKDVNDFALAGHDVAAFRGLAAAAPTLIEHLARAIPRDAAIVDRERALREVLELVAPLSSIQRDDYIGRLKGWTGFGKKVLEEALGDTLRVRNGAAAAAPSVMAGPRFVFDARRERIPAQDYSFNSPAVGNMTVYMQLERERLADNGEAFKDTTWEPVLVTVTHKDGAWSIDWVAAADAGLTRREISRLPFESVAKGRWRIEPQHAQGVARFIEGTAPAVNAWQLFEAICKTFKAHIWLTNPLDYELLALFVLQSYVYQLFDSVGYLHLTGSKGSGKSNTSLLLEALCFNAVKSSNQTAAVLFRSVEANCGVRIMDEAERLADPKPGTPDFDMMLMANDGYKRGARAERMKEAPKGSLVDFTVQDFDLYSPKVIAGINDVNAVLASRCIQISFKRALAADFMATGIRDLAQSKRRLEKHLPHVRDQIYCWALQCFPKVQESAEHIEDDPALSHLMGRDREMWMPLLALAFHVDDARAMLAADGDEARAQKIADTWSDQGDLVFLRMIGLQREKESSRRVTENDTSIDIAIIKTLHELLAAGDEVRPVTTTLGEGALYGVPDLAKLVSDELTGAGIITRDRPITGQRLIRLLTKAGVVSNASARKDVMVRDPESGRRRAIRCLALTPEALEACITRLGGSHEQAS